MSNYRVSRAMEAYAERACRLREKQEAKEKGERRIGDCVLSAYLAEGHHLEKAVKAETPLDRMAYILKHQELIVSSDGAEGINIVWCPNSQVMTHRVLSSKMRAELGGRHYLGTWVRQAPSWQHDALRAELKESLEIRVERRRLQPTLWEMTDEEIWSDVPQFMALAQA